MKRLWLVLLLIAPLSLIAQAPAPAKTGPDPFKALSFLDGTWDANVTNNGAIKLSGRYRFKKELDGHILARHSSNDPGCKGPADFDCAHGDLLYVFEEFPGAPLKAIYFDNEGHVIHYGVSTPTPTSVVFLSEPSPGPQFRLTYELKANVMTGRFEMHMPGPGDWHVYLEWSGGRN